LRKSHQVDQTELLETLTEPTLNFINLCILSSWSFKLHMIWVRNITITNSYIDMLHIFGLLCTQILDFLLLSFFLNFCYLYRRAIFTRINARNIFGNSREGEQHSHSTAQRAAESKRNIRTRCWAYSALSYRWGISVTI